MSRRRMRRMGFAVLGSIVFNAAAHAHSPVLSCFDNEDGSITCEGGFSDGASAEGVALRVLDARNKVLIDGKMDKTGAYKFKKPAVAYRVVFDAGDNHKVTIDGADITK